MKIIIGCSTSKMNVFRVGAVGLIMTAEDQKCGSWKHFIFKQYINQMINQSGK